MNSSLGDASRVVLAARAEASAWITRLHGPNRSTEMEEGFQRWLRERPENAQEFEGLTEVWDIVASGVPTRGVPRLQHSEWSVETQDIQNLRATERLKVPRMIPWAAAAALAIIGCGIFAHRFWPSMSYATAVGEQRIVQLDDGTRVSLNSNSRVAVDYDESARQIQLIEGEALFQVARDAQRPFVVVAGDNRVTALGTSFLVRLEGSRTAITLVEGKVAVVPSLRGALASNTPPTGDSELRGEQLTGIILSPGQRVTLEPTNKPKLDEPQLDTLTAWRRGEVLLSDTPLAEAVAEMNRYDKTRIVIASPQIENLEVSGLYHTGDSEGFARSVVQMYQLKMLMRDGQIRLER